MKDGIDILNKKIEAQQAEIDRLKGDLTASKALADVRQIDIDQLKAEARTLRNVGCDDAELIEAQKTEILALQERAAEDEKLISDAKEALATMMSRYAKRGERMKALFSVLDELVTLMDDVQHHAYTPDSFTTQPARLLLANLFDVNGEPK